MNMVLLALVALVSLIVLTLIQAAALWFVAERPFWRLPLRHASESSAVRWTMKVGLQIALALLLFGVPALRGHDPIQYHLDRLRLDRAGDLLATMVPTVIATALIFVVFGLGGWVTFGPRYPGRTLASKLLKACVSPLPLTLVEEAVFRGIVTEQFVRDWGETGPGLVAALGVSALVFSSVHFIRPQRGSMLPAQGLFAFGVLLSLAYLMTGHSYWAPIGIHAGGVLVVQLCRPFATYWGPTWLVGYPAYPIAGVVGMGVLGSLAVYLVSAGILV